MNPLRTQPTTNEDNMTCSCGNPEPHVIARRQTYDGREVNLWSDGDLTQLLGIRIPGLGMPRSDASRRANMEVIKNVCLYNLNEIPAKVKELRKKLRAGA
ncbi:MAG: hypothetical protein LAT68_16535 [Cyclobacteriaceae bacterium]|nr:hypothetical protein [Cyclobacteriaceae bacterium]